MTNEIAESPAPAPELLVSARVSVYATPKGGVHVALRVDGEDTDRHLEPPSALLKLLAARLGVDPVTALRAIRDGNLAG